MIDPVILEPPPGDDPSGLKLAGWWHTEEDHVVCDLCPRGCSLKEGAFA